MVPAKFHILFIKSQLKYYDGPNVFHTFFSLPPSLPLYNILFIDQSNSLSIPLHLFHPPLGASPTHLFW